MKKIYKTLNGSTKPHAAWRRSLLSLVMAGAVYSSGFSQTYTFTPANATGENGPTQAQVTAAYAATNLNNSVTVTGGIQYFTVPFTGPYRIIAVGAKGSYNGGLPAYTSGDFTLTAGTILKILVGQRGTTGYTTNSPSFSAGGGGGGSYVTNSTNVPYVVAGGGGGNGDGYSGIPVTCCTSGMEATLVNNANPYPSGANGGTGGNGGTCNGWTAGSGAGITGNASACNSAIAALSFVNGGTGGTGNFYSGAAGVGGFGGGGGNSDSGTGMRGGGGGGYSGGGGGVANTGNDAAGGGGGSYVSGANPTASVCTTDESKVYIQLLCSISLVSTAASGTNAPICSGGSATLSTNGISNYSWSNGSTNSTIVVSPTVTTVYTVTAMSVQNCTVGAAITVTVDNTPTVTAVRSSSAVCSGKLLTLTGAGATSYTWTNGTTTVPNATAFTPAATSGYTVTGGNACGTATAATAVTVNPLPSVGGSVNNPTVCSGNNVIFNGTGSVNGYTWTGGVTNNVSYIPSATANYTVTGVSAEGCTNTAVVGSTVLVTPSVSPVVTPTAICLGKTATLSATGATGYTWTAPPNTAFSNANTVTVSPTGSTTYTLTRLNGACPSVMTVSLLINGLPSIIAGTPNPSVVCANNAANLSATGAITYTWYPGGFQGSSVMVYPNYSQNLVTYTVVASNANCTISAVSSVSTNPNPTLTINPSSTVICAGGTATLTANGATTYTWMSPVNQAQQSVTVSPMIPTLYNVSGTNIYGCVSQQNQVLLVNAAPNVTASIANPGNYICAGGIGTLVAIGTGPTNYSWSTGSSAPSTTVNPISTMVYTVTGINPTTLCQNTSTVALAVYISTFTVVSPTAICKGQTATLTASGAATTYTWNTNATAPSITVSPLGGSIYYVTGITGNCSTTQSISLGVNAIPPVTAAAVKGTICRFEPGMLTASGATTYSWSTSANTSSITVTPTVTTTYTVTGTDNNGCSKTVNVTLFINACLGIAEVNGNVDNLLSIYPNPSNGEFTIKADAAMNIRIVNETGQLVKYMSLTDANSQVNVNNLANGIYFIVAEKDGSTATKKVVVSK